MGSASVERAPRSLQGMEMVVTAVSSYLVADRVIDYEEPSVSALARDLREGRSADDAFAKAAFEFVRDEIAHSADVQDRRVTLLASQTLHEGVGLCFSKAHLLTAVLRSQGVPAGLCYQRLTDDGTHFDLHGLVAVHLHGDWHRQDPRGNKPGVDAQFSLGHERLAWPVRPELGECDYAEVLVNPHPSVVTAFTRATDMLDLCDGGLPSGLDT